MAFSEVRNARAQKRIGHMADAQATNGQTQRQEPWGTAFCAWSRPEPRLKPDSPASQASLIGLFTECLEEAFSEVRRYKPEPDVAHRVPWRHRSLRLLHLRRSPR